MSTEVNKERVALWVEALRSGEYHQGLGHLELRGRNGGTDQHCCLGVAVRLAMAGGAPIRAETLETDPVTEFSSISDAGHSQPTVGHLPQAAAEWFGLPMQSEISTNVIVRYRNTRMQLTQLNDSLKLTFDEIADVIEEMYL